MSPSRFLAQAAVSLVLVLRANAESHVIKFVNQCGYGSPALMYNGQNILTSDSYTSNGPWSGIAYLQTGYCGANGENCTLLETTLINPTCAGCGSSTDLSLIPPHTYSVETSFAYYNGCDGQGQTCSNPSCTNAAFFAPNDNFVQVACEINNANLLVTFCADAAQFVTGSGNATSAGSSSPSTSSLPPPSSTPTLGSSIPGSVPPVTPPVSSKPSTPPTSEPSSTPTQTPTVINDGCGGTGSAIPSSAPAVTPSEPVTSIPTSTPTSTTPIPTIPMNSAPAPGSGSASVPGSASPTTSPCRPRPTSLTPSNSAPTNPASATPTLPAPPTFTPSTTPSTTPATSAGTSDPCGDLGSASPSSTPPAQRRRHRHYNRVQY